MRVILALLLASASCAAAQSTAPSTTVATAAPAEIADPFPPAEQYAKLIGPIGRKYNVPIPGKSFHELRALRLTPDGRVHRPEPDAPELALPPGSATYTYVVPTSQPSEREKSYGLFVWVAPEKGAGMAMISKRLRGWLEVLDRHDLIWVEPHDAPNESHSVWRAFAALEAVRNARRRHTIDPDRVYIAGLSGGGRISSHTAVFYPDVFSGAFAMVGCNFFRDVPVPGQKNRVWPGFWANPDLKTVARARANSRIVLLTGTTDFNHESTRAMYDEFVKDKWAYVTYLDVPGMGHEFPDADWFEKGIVALDTPLAALAQARYDAAVEAEKKRKLGEACLGFESAARHGKDKPFVPDARSRGAAVRKKYQQQLASIEKLIEAKQFDRAAPAIRQLKQDYSPLSDETADELLERIKQLRKPATRAAEPS